LDIENNYNKRRMSEILHIKEQIEGINSQKDAENLDKSYFALLKFIKTKTNKSEFFCLLNDFSHLNLSVKA